MGRRSVTIDYLRSLRTRQHTGSIQTLSDLSQDLIAQIEHFFVSYNEMKGKRFRVKGQAGTNRALTLVKAAMKRRGR